MNYSVETKSKVLEMLEHFMMGEHGKRMAPKTPEDMAGDAIGEEGK